MMIDSLLKRLLRERAMSATEIIYTVYEARFVYDVIGSILILAVFGGVVNKIIR